MHWPVGAARDEAPLPSGQDAAAPPQIPLRPGSGQASRRCGGADKDVVAAQNDRACAPAGGEQRLVAVGHSEDRICDSLTLARNLGLLGGSGRCFCVRRGWLRRNFCVLRWPAPLCFGAPARDLGAGRPPARPGLPAGRRPGRPGRATPAGRPRPSSPGDLRRLGAAPGRPAFPRILAAKAAWAGNLFPLGHVSLTDMNCAFLHGRRTVVYKGVDTGRAQIVRSDAIAGGLMKQYIAKEEVIMIRRQR